MSVLKKKKKKGVLKKCHCEKRKGEQCTEKCENQPKGTEYKYGVLKSQKNQTHNNNLKL